MGTLSALSPAALWKNFEALCAIPRPSKHEAKVSAYVQQFGRELGLSVATDQVGNVLIRKPATPGMENRKRVVLQAHLDMVPQKNADTQHDFKTDPIRPYVDGEWVKAQGTTLGSDNGIGVAAMLAVLQSTDLAHPAIEALFTIDEETGMTGAFGLQPDFVQADILLNLDSEDEGELYIGCAGGIECTATFAYQTETLDNTFTAYKLNVKGLKGGHSGLDIKLGRGNSNKIMNRLLYALHTQHGIRLSKLTGGSLRNAIPRESFAEIALPSAQLPAALALVQQLKAEIKAELSVTEPDLEIEMLPLETVAPAITPYVDTDTALRFYRALYAAPNGVIRVSDTMEGLTETSLNLAVITVKNNQIKVKSLLRSSVDTAKADLVRMLENVFVLAGATVETSGNYPGWKPNPKSEILDAMKEVYRQNWGRVPEVKAIHAGLECGLLGGVYPQWDMISFGPTIRFPHSPDEKVNIQSVQLFWDYLVATLRAIPLA